MGWWLSFIVFTAFIFMGCVVVFGVIDELFNIYDTNFNVVVLIMVVVSVLGSVIITNVIFDNIKKDNQARLDRGDTCVLETRPLKAIDMNIETQERVSGSYFLFFGGVEGGTSEQLYYYFYAKLNEGYKLYKVPMSYVEIVETNDIEPSIKAPYNVYRNNYCIVVDGGYRTVVIYVPVGSIVPTYDLDVSKIGGE